MKQTDVYFLLAMLAFIILFYGFFWLRKWKRHVYLKAASRKNIKALQYLEDEGYRFSNGAQCRRVLQTINGTQYTREIMVEMIVRKDWKQYLVVHSKTQKERLDRVTNRLEFILLQQLFPSDGILVVDLISPKISVLKQKISYGHDYSYLKKRWWLPVLVLFVGLFVGLFLDL